MARSTGNMGFRPRLHVDLLAAPEQESASFFGIIQNVKTGSFSSRNGKVECYSENERNLVGTIGQKSPYSAAFTGCGFMLDEMLALLPLMLAPDAEERLKSEISGNKLLFIGKTKTRDRMITEFRRRFKSVSRTFWDWFQSLPRESQPGALFFVLLKTYYFLLDIQLKVVLPLSRSACNRISKADVMMRLNDIAASDDFVESWSGQTKDRVCSGVLSFLRSAGMLGDDDVIRPLKLRDEDFAHFIAIGEGWFLEAAMLQPFEIERIKGCLK